VMSAEHAKLAIDKMIALRDGWFPVSFDAVKLQSSEVRVDDLMKWDNGKLIAAATMGYRYLLGAFRPRISGHGACFLIDISREHLPLRCLNLGEQSVKGFVLLRRRRPLSQSCA